jgi:hypothetical protein
LELQYDTRQRVSVFNVRNQNQQDVMKIEYQYHSTNQVKRTTNLTYDGFNRNFGYDNVGRLKSADTDPIPGVGSSYYQTLNYDAWDNLTSRSSGIWGTSYDANYWNSYSNNRNTQAQSWNSSSGVMPNEIWQFDASGMPTRTGEQAHKYDAAGRKVESIETPPSLPSGQTGRVQLLIQQIFDGEGQTGKRYERETFGTGAVTNKTNYYLHSTVLGGKLLAELNEQGQKQKEYVYDDGGKAIARRENNEIRWLQTAPSIGTNLETATNGNVLEQKEYEPSGGEISITPPPVGSPDWLYSGNYQHSGNPADGNSGCSRKGFPIDCSEVVRDVMFGDPRTLNDTCPGCGAGGGMWLSPEQVGGLESGTSFDEWDWLRAGERLIKDVRSGGGFVFANIAQTNKQTKDKLPSNFKDRVLDLVDDNCADFLDKLFNALSKVKSDFALKEDLSFEPPPNGAKIGSKEHIGHLFDRVDKAKGFNLVDKLDNPDSGGHSSGSGNKRKVEILRTPNTNSDYKFFHYDYVALQELIHHAQKNDTYSDNNIDDAALSLLTENERKEYLERYKGKQAGSIGHQLVWENCFKNKRPPSAPTK